MKKSTLSSHIVLVFSILIISVFFANCKKTEDPIKFPLGTFPDTVINLASINSVYDDYNVDVYELTGNSPIIFSSNRKSSGGQFDLEQANLDFRFDQTTGVFELTASMSNDPYLSKLITTAVTPGNDFGPYRFFSSVDGYEYMIVSSVNAQGNLDLYYIKNRPYYGTTLPEVEGPTPLKIFNTASDDGYFSLNLKMDSAYFTSDRNGNFDIYLHKKPDGMEMSAWFNLEYSASALADSVNSPYDDKCPMIFRDIMVFTSNRPGGLGGFDLYYSMFKKGKWNSPVNLGPGINTSSDEYRPIIGYHPEFTNYMLMFSSSRPGGKGGFDLYYTGVEFP